MDNNHPRLDMDHDPLDCVASTLNCTAEMVAPRGVDIPQGFAEIFPHDA